MDVVWLFVVLEWWLSVGGRCSLRVVRCVSFVGYWLSVVGCWWWCVRCVFCVWCCLILLVCSCWLFVGCWLWLSVGGWLLVVDKIVNVD